MEAEQTASEDVVAQREEALAKQLSEMRRRKKRLVDPLQFEMSIQAEDLSSYVPAFGWEMGPPSDKQAQTLEKLGICPDDITCAGKAAKILDKLDNRRNAGLTTPKQVRFLEGRGFQHARCAPAWADRPLWEGRGARAAQGRSQRTEGQSCSGREGAGRRDSDRVGEETWTAHRSCASRYST